MCVLAPTHEVCPQIMCPENHLIPEDCRRPNFVIGSDNITRCRVCDSSLCGMYTVYRIVRIVYNKCASVWAIFVIRVIFSILKCSHTIACCIDVGERMRKRSCTLIYVKGTLAHLGLRCVIRRGQFMFWTRSKQFNSVCERISYMQRIRLSYARHTLSTRMLEWR